MYVAFINDANCPHSWVFAQVLCHGTESKCSSQSHKSEYRKSFHLIWNWRTSLINLAYLLQPVLLFFSECVLFNSFKYVALAYTQHLSKYTFKISAKWLKKSKWRNYEDYIIPFLNKKSLICLTWSFLRQNILLPNSLILIVAYANSHKQTQKNFEAKYIAIKVNSRSETFFNHWKPFKNNEKTFYFILKAFFVLEIFKFLSWLFDHWERWLD